MADFDLHKALSGASLLLNDNKSIVQFRKSGIQKASQEYVGIGADNTVYYFNDKGETPSGEELTIASYSIDSTFGTEATRGGTNINIDNMQPRELFAQSAMQAIITKLDIPILSMDNYTIKLVAELSYNIAQEMYNQGAVKRADQKEEEEPAPIDVDINNVTSTTDKILYNMAQDIKKLQESLEYEEIIEVEGEEPTTEKKSVLVKLQENIQGLEEAIKKQNEENYVRKIDINKVTATSLPVQVNNEKVSVLVTNESLAITQKTPVEITGTVKVDNTTEEEPGVEPATT